MSQTSCEASTQRKATSGNDAAWRLVLPQARHVLCHASEESDLFEELAGDACVDIVWRGKLHEPDATWKGTLRFLRQPDPQKTYDLALLWNPASRADLDAWFSDLAGLAHRPDDVAVWSLNPWRGEEAPHWWVLDHDLRRGGLRLGDAHLALPGPKRVRQIVEWDAYGSTTLVQHRRTHRAWKAWVTRRGAYRWVLPARLRLASTPSSTPKVSGVESMRRDVVGRYGEPVEIERLLVSPNGTGIVCLRLGAGRDPKRAVLKTAYTRGAEARVLRNATALEWLESRSEALGSWSGAAPRLLTRGRAGGWHYTLEESVGNGGARSLGEDTAGSTRDQLVGYLEAFDRMGAPPRVLDTETYQGLIGSQIEHIATLLEPSEAHRFRGLLEEQLGDLRSIPLPLVPRHGDFKLDNVIQEETGRLRILDWELWSECGLPLLDAWHLVAWSLTRKERCSLGGVVSRFLLPRHLHVKDEEILDRLARGLDPRYFELSPLLYWLDRVAPVAARGAWPTFGWVHSNVVPVLDVLQERSGVLR